MLNNNYACQFCGGALRTGTGRMGAQCTRCGRYYSFEQLYRLASFRQPDKKADSEKNAAMAAIVVAAVMIFTLLLASAPFTAVCIFPIALVLGAVKFADKCEPLPVGAAEKLSTADDYLREFRMLPLERMPLREEAGRAIMQIDLLKRKQIALASMLDQDHPFIKSGNDAAAYILNNLKQVLYRLQFCDQNDPGLRKMHAEFLRERLDENDRVLRDYENLIIEVTQMSDQTPVTAPTLDVLADTLRCIRTGEQIPSEAEMVYSGSTSLMRGERE